MEDSTRTLISCVSDDKSNLLCADLANWVKCLPEEFKGVSWPTCKDLSTGLLDFGKNWASTYPFTSLFLYGGWGSGKTTFSFSCIRQLMENVRGKGYFWPNYITGEKLESALLSALKNESGDSYELEKWTISDLLFIDDLDKANTTDRFKKQLFTIINERMVHNRPTIITSNCSPDELASILDGALLSRMSDRTKWTIIEFTNGDFRKKKIHINKF